MGERRERREMGATIVITTFKIYVILKYTFFLWVSPTAKFCSWDSFCVFGSLSGKSKKS